MEINFFHCLAGWWVGGGGVKIQLNQNSMNFFFQFGQWVGGWGVGGKKYT